MLQTSDRKEQCFPALELSPTRLSPQTTFHILVHPNQTTLTFSFYLVPLYQTTYILNLPVYASQFAVPNT